MLIVKKKGFSLLELMLVLGLISGLAAAAFYAYKKVQDSYNINTAVKQIISLKTVILQSYAGQGNYEGLDNPTIILSVPDDLKSGSSIINIYKYSVGVSGSWMTASKAGNSGYYIDYRVKKEDCFQIVKRLVPAFNYILINTNTAVDNITGKISTDTQLYSYCTSLTNKYSELQLYGS